MQLPSQLSKSESGLFAKLNTPAKVQDFIDSIPINFENRRETCMSPRMVLQNRRAHCMEAAMLAAAILRHHGYPPLIVDLRAARPDYNHAIAVFKVRGKWGAISKANHAVLRYREPLYRDIRELVMSYFHEYFLDNGRKTLRSYSLPVDLSRFDRRGWMTARSGLWYIDKYLDKTKHFPLIDSRQTKNLRKADKLEIKAGKLTQWKKIRQ